jgi:hypothetical protein
MSTINEWCYVIRPYEGMPNWFVVGTKDPVLATKFHYFASRLMAHLKIAGPHALTLLFVESEPAFDLHETSPEIMACSLMLNVEKYLGTKPEFVNAVKTIMKNETDHAMLYIKVSDLYHREILRKSRVAVTEETNTAVVSLQKEKRPAKENPAPKKSAKVVAPEQEPPRTHMPL